MLQIKNRLTKVRDFNLLLERGMWFNSASFSLRVLCLEKNKNFFPPQEDKGLFAEQLRAGFTVGLKLSKSAVKRNRLKRQMREIVRLLIKEDKIKPGYYFLFVAKPGATSLGYSQIEEQIIGLLKKGECLLK
jgi:ribonuclease P protein component